jgi:osmotically-inducible protein OsmY
MEIVDRVMEALRNDPRTEDVEIDVVDDLGVLTLRGMVDQVYIRDAAEEIARRQDGVLSVINEIKVY